MKAVDLIDALKKKLRTDSYQALSAAMGVSVQTLSNWSKSRHDLKPAQVASALAKSRSAAVKSSQFLTIRPIVEFYQLDPCLNKKESAWKLFSVDNDATTYAHGLKDLLMAHTGYTSFMTREGRRFTSERHVSNLYEKR